VKLVALWVAVVLIAVAAAGSCSINHRSADFACENTNDCASGRICSDGFCVSTRPIDAGVDARIDASIDAAPPIDASEACPEQCTSCDIDARSCRVDCGVDAELCNRPINCPAGWSCDIECSRRGSCGTINCTDSTACTISCDAGQTCTDVTCGDASCEIDCLGADSCFDVDCGTGKCDVRCAGLASCDLVDCGRACACDVTCGLSANCFGVTCPTDDCTDPFGDCSSLGQGCNICP
jgi:hypothetical protein